MDGIVAALAIASSDAIAFAFWRPRGVFHFAGLTLLCAVCAPFVVALALSPLLGSGAGLGVALILYVVSAALGGLAMAAAIGAALRYGWNALR